MKMIAAMKLSMRVVLRKSFPKIPTQLSNSRDFFITSSYFKMTIEVKSFCE